MPARVGNRFLDSLSQKSRSEITRVCVEVDLPLRKVLFDPGDVPQYAYFLTSGIASVVTMMEDGGMAEVGLIGREGVVGSFHLLGPAKVSTNCFIQLEATALRMRFADLKEMFGENEEIRGRVLETVQEQAVGLAQLAGCNRLHENEQRLARWLLMAQDRVDSDALNFTQEFLAMMLGSRRTTVTLVAGILQRKGLIKYQRGRVRILNRRELEAASCDCYQVVKELYFSLYGDSLQKAGRHEDEGVGVRSRKSGARKGLPERPKARKVRGGEKVERGTAKEPVRRGGSGVGRGRSRKAKA